MLLGSREFIAKARIGRKLLGGGMRQAGVIAAAGLIALEESPKRLHEDQANAQHLARGLAGLQGISIDPRNVATNIVIFDVQGTGRTAAEISDEIGRLNVLCSATDKFAVRMVTHCDVDRAGVEKAIRAVAKVVGERSRTSAKTS